MRYAPKKPRDAIYAFKSIGYSKDIDAWLARCWRMLKPGGRLLIRSPGSLDFCRREKDYQSVTAFFDNWRYNFLGANVLTFNCAGSASARSRRARMYGRRGICVASSAEQEPSPWRVR